MAINGKKVAQAIKKVAQDADSRKVYAVGFVNAQGKRDVATVKAESAQSARKTFLSQYGHEYQIYAIQEMK